MVEKSDIVLRSLAIQQGRLKIGVGRGAVKGGANKYRDRGRSGVTPGRPANVGQAEGVSACCSHTARPSGLHSYTAGLPSLEDSSDLDPHVSLTPGAGGWFHNTYVRRANSDVA